MESYLLLGGILFPILVISWLLCIFCFVYKSIVKNRGSTKVQVLESSRRSSSSSDDSGGQRRPQTTSTLAASHQSTRFNAGATHMPGMVMPDVEDDLRGRYGPVVLVPDGLKRSLEAQGKSLSDSLGPVYYPKHPQNQSPMNDTPKRQSMSPMTPLQPPWPHLPPLGKANQKHHGRVPTSVRSFLDQQRLS